MQIIIFLFFVFCAPLYAYKYEVSIAAIFQNEAPYLREWIEFHKLVGVEHFYLYNNLSTDNYLEVLKPYVHSGEVELIPWDYPTLPDGSNWPAIQVSAYNHAIHLAKRQSKWLAILDIDEFLFPVQVDTLPEFLKDYKKFAGVAVNWQMYGTSGVERLQPGQLMIEALLMKAPLKFHENMHIKSIVRPECVENASVHYCLLRAGFKQVNSEKETIRDSFSPIHVDKIRINHYWTRDEEYFLNYKIPRRQKWHIQEDPFLRKNILNTEEDPAILKYADKLREALFP